MALGKAFGEALAGFLSGIIGIFTAWWDRNKRAEAESKLKALEAHKSGEQECAAMEGHITSEAEAARAKADADAKALSAQEKLDYINSKNR